MCKFKLKLTKRKNMAYKHRHTLTCANPSTEYEAKWRRKMWYEKLWWAQNKNILSIIAWKKNWNWDCVQRFLHASVFRYKHYYLLVWYTAINQHADLKIFCLFICLYILSFPPILLARIPDHIVSWPLH